MQAPADPPETEFERAYEEYSPRVFRYCLCLLHDPSRAEEITQDVFLRAHIAWRPATRRTGEVLPWLFTIARHAVVDDLRRRRRFGVVLSRLHGLARTETAPDPAEHVEFRARTRQVVEAMRALKERDRMLLALRLGGELTYQEMAEALGEHEHAVAMATRRAVGRLRERVGDAP